MLLLTLAAAALIPPPPGGTPPHVSGPGNFCGRTFSLRLLPSESVEVSSPGEIPTDDMHGIYRVASRVGNVDISEVGARTRQRGRSTVIRGTAFRQYGPVTYSLTVQRGGVVKAVTVFFPDLTLPDDAAEVLRRIRLKGPNSSNCLRPQGL